MLQANGVFSDKFYNLTGPFLKSIVNDHSDEEFPFDLSPEELEIVKHFSTSSLILGRSGTGKTTCLLFKMLAKHRARQSGSDEQQARQVCLFLFKPPEQQLTSKASLDSLILFGFEASDIRQESH